VDSQQARQILELYRPGVDDADPQFAEALAFVQRDPELRRWLEEQRAVYAAIRDKIREIPVPAELQDQILAERKVVRLPVAWWRSQFLKGAAAVAVICLSIYAIFVQLDSWNRTRNGPTNFAAFRAEMTYFAAAGYNLDVHSDSLDELRQQFVRNGWPSDYSVPAGMTKLSVRGGCLMKWQNHKVSMLCLKSSDQHGVWLYVIERTALPDPPRDSTPQLATEGKLAMASWSADGKTYVLAAEGNEEFLRTLL
jgi:uncharacterized membrane protein YbaN (DUF454 family)